MNILAFSDLHGDLNAAEGIVSASHSVDVVVGAGDFGNRGRNTLDTLMILRSSKAPVVLVHGNHDDPHDIAAFCADWPSGHYLHGEGVMIHGIRFFGLGGEVPARNEESWNASETETVAAKMFARCQAATVLLTHTPPLGLADLQRDGSHEGSKAVRDAVLRIRPTLCLSGHIHHSWGARGFLEDTDVRNLGPEASLIALTPPERRGAAT